MGQSCAPTIVCRNELHTQLLNFCFGLLLRDCEVCFCELPVVVCLRDFMHGDKGVEQIAVFLDAPLCDDHCVFRDDETTLL